MARTKILVSTLFLLVLLGAACNGTQSDSSDEGVELQNQSRSGERLGQDSKGAAEPDLGAPAPVEGQAAPDIAQDHNSVPQAPLPPLPGTKVIKNASVHIEVKKGSFQDKFSKAGTIAESLGGFVTNSSVSKVEDKVALGDITIRVPADKYQAALSQLKELGEVTDESSSSQDVSREFVDLEARERHLRTQEAFLLRLIGEATNVSEMIAIQQQLSNVQLQLEQILGQLQYLRDQTSYSTITAHIFEPDAAPGPEPKGIGKAWAEAIAAFKTVISGLIVALGWVAPFALLALAGLIGWRIARRPRDPDLGAGEENRTPA